MVGTHAGPYIGKLSVAFIFNWRMVDFHGYVGWMLILTMLLNGVLGAVYLMWLVSHHHD